MTRPLPDEWTAGAARGDRRGVALVLVLWLVVILGTIAASVMTVVRGTSSLASNARASVVARAAAESGVELAVAAIEDTLALLTDSAAQRDFLNAVASRPDADSIAIGDGRFAVMADDPGARLDVNRAATAELSRLLAHFTDPLDAEAQARAIRAWIERPLAERSGAPLGAPPVGASPVTHPLRSLEELRGVPGVDARLLQLSARHLTVDGDGSINRALASDTVLAAATGELRDAPSRLVFVSRGWMHGHPLTHEIQAVYAFSADRLVLVHWRERAL